MTFLYRKTYDPQLRCQTISTVCRGQGWPLSPIQKQDEFNYLILPFGLLTSIGLGVTSAVFQFFFPIYFALVFFQFLIFEGWNTTWPSGATAKRKEISPRHVKKIDRIGHSATRKILTVDETRRCWGVKSLGHAGGRRDDVDIGLPIRHQIDGLTSGFIPLVMY